MNKKIQSIQLEISELNKQIVDSIMYGDPIDTRILRVDRDLLLMDLEELVEDEAMNNFYSD